MYSIRPRRFEQLAIVERALALAFQTPAFVPREMPATEEERIAVLGPAFGELAAALSKDWDKINGMLVEVYHQKSSADYMPHQHSLYVRSWVENLRGYASNRRRAIAALIAMRERILESLRVIPDPSGDDEENNAAPLFPQDEDTAAPKWLALTDRQREIVRAVGRGRPLNAKQIAAKINEPQANIRQAVADLRRRGVLGNTRGSGYFIDVVPIGAPPELVRANSAGA